MQGEGKFIQRLKIEININTGTRQIISNNYQFAMDEVIKVGQYIVIQRQNFTKLHKFNNLDATVQMGRDTIELKNINEHHWQKTFKMQLKASGKKRLYTLEPCDNIADTKEILKSIESGVDNRNINDDGQASALRLQ